MKKYLAILFCLIILSLNAVGCSAPPPSSEAPQESADPVIWEAVFADRHSTLSREDSAVLSELLRCEKWIGDLTDCAWDAELTSEGGDRLRYSSDCGTLNDLNHRRSLRLDDQQTRLLNSLLSNYGVLGFDAAQPPLFDVRPEDISLITYNDNSASPDTPVSTYTDKDEIARILQQFRSLELTEWDGTTYEEVEPGNYCSYTVSFQDGSSAAVTRSGNYIYYDDRRYQGALYQQLHKDASIIDIRDSIGIPDDMKLRMTIAAYDEENTLVTVPPELSVFDGSRWNTVERISDASAAQIAVADMPAYFDLSEYQDISPGDYRVRYTIVYPSGRTDTLTTRFFLFS